jgi:hypothetical protein
MNAWNVILILCVISKQGQILLFCSAGEAPPPSRGGDIDSGDSITNDRQINPLLEQESKVERDQDPGIDGDNFISNSNPTELPQEESLPSSIEKNSFTESNLTDAVSIDMDVDANHGDETIGIDQESKECIAGIADSSKTQHHETFSLTDNLPIASSEADEDIEGSIVQAITTEEKLKNDIVARAVADSHCMSTETDNDVRDKADEASSDSIIIDSTKDSTNSYSLGETKKQTGGTNQPTEDAKNDDTNSGRTGFVNQPRVHRNIKDQADEETIALAEIPEISRVDDSSIFFDHESLNEEHGILTNNFASRSDPSEDDLTNENHERAVLEGNTQYARHTKNYRGIWGMYRVGERPPDMKILFEVFEYRIQEKLGISSIPESMLQENIFPLGIGEAENEGEKHYTMPKNDSGNPKLESTSDHGDANSDFVEGIDDIENFFEGVDPPDELDVGASGSSIQDMLMKKGKEILFKRIAIGLKVLKRCLQSTKTNLSKQLNDRRRGEVRKGDIVIRIFKKAKSAYEEVVSLLDDVLEGNKKEEASDDFDNFQRRRVDEYQGSRGQRQR